VVIGIKKMNFNDVLLSGSIYDELASGVTEHDPKFPGNRREKIPRNAMRVKPGIPKRTISREPAHEHSADTR
jgi:hypothetical protein